MRGKAATGKHGLQPLRLPRAVELLRGYGIDGQWYARSRATARRLDADIDTGASRSCIPQSLVVTEGLRVTGTTLVGDWRGGYQDEDLYLVRVRVCSVTFERQFIAHRDPTFLLGRDVLEQLFLALDGPARSFCLRKPGRFERVMRRLSRAP